MVTSYDYFVWFLRMVTSYDYFVWLLCVVTVYDNFVCFFFFFFCMATFSLNHDVNDNEDDGRATALDLLKDEFYCFLG